MPDQFLVGNGRWCSTCHGTGRPATRISGQKKLARRGCNECAGKGRIAFTAEEIVAATVAENREWRKTHAPL
jgi:DnaJ-class molecular chaperone